MTARPGRGDDRRPRPSSPAETSGDFARGGRRDWPVWTSRSLSSVQVLEVFRACCGLAARGTLRRQPPGCVRDICHLEAGRPDRRYEGVPCRRGGDHIRVRAVAGRDNRAKAGRGRDAGRGFAAGVWGIGIGAHMSEAGLGTGGPERTRSVTSAGVLCQTGDSRRQSPVWQCVCMRFFATLECALLDRRKFRTRAEAWIASFEGHPRPGQPLASSFGRGLHVSHQRRMDRR